MKSLGELRAELLSKSPLLVEAVFDSLAKNLIPAKSGSASDAGNRAFNDPIWKIISLTPLEAAIVDLPLMQRLRRVRQLGLAYLVYPGAHHTRLEHSIGAVQAAGLMYKALASTCEPLKDNTKQRLESMVRLAALLHDCGHPAFSHVGERFLQTQYKGEFSFVSDVLLQSFSDPVHLQSAASAVTSSGKPPPAAELLSVLFVLSPAMEQFLRGFLLPDSVENTVITIAGLILGRPANLRDDAHHFHFVQSIVSGDLDADKLDYVARDAYYTGLPVSADPDRLLSQLTSAKLDQHTNFPDGQVTFGSPDPDVYHLLAIRPAGVSALEMFVMTRSYLFERVYGHHKIRGGERFLERVIRIRMGYAKNNQNWDIRQILNHLVGLAGDDALLYEASVLKQLEPAAQKVSERALDILERRLPKRALALSPRMLLEFSKETRSIAPSIFQPWNEAEGYFTNMDRLRDFEDELCSASSTPLGFQTFIDRPQPNPIKEDPDIWVVDPVAKNEIIRLNKYFDVEQLSNAYRDVKQVTWVFAPAGSMNQVAASAAFMLAKKFDLCIGDEALRRAKVPRKSFIEAISAIKNGADPADVAVAENLLVGNQKARLFPRPSQFESAFRPSIDSAELPLLSSRLSEAFAQTGFLRIFSDELSFALYIVSMLAQHAHAIWTHADFKESIPNGNEARFQDDLIRHMDRLDKGMRGFEYAPHTEAGGGFTDLIFKSSGQPSLRSVVCELKSERKPSLQQQEEHASQSARYSEKNYARVSILYGQFESADPVTLADTVQIRVSGSVGAHPHVIICLGTKAFAAVPSRSGAASRAIVVP